MSSLLARTTDTTSSLERGGAAQALVEVLAAIGPERLESTLLGDFMHSSSTSPEPHIREGLLWTFAFLPVVLGRHFASLIDIVLPTIIKALADEADMVLGSLCRRVRRGQGHHLRRSHSRR